MMKLKRKFKNTLKLMAVKTKPYKIYVVAQSLSHVQPFVTPWTAAHQAPLSFTISRGKDFRSLQGDPTN